MAEQMKPTSAAEFRRRSTFIVKVDDSLTIELKRSDMMTMLMNGSMPMPMIEAAMNFERTMTEQAKQRREQGLPTLTQAEQYGSMDKSLINDMLSAMRQYAVVHAVNPIIVPKDDGNPDHLDVNLLNATQLFGIFYAAPDGDQKEGPIITTEEAKEFRGSPAPDVSDAGPARTEVRPSAKLLDLPQRQVISA
jgi:hypothetical protein